MSHLKHITTFKLELDTLGITCPIKQQDLTLEAYMRAIVIRQFQTGRCFVLSDDAEQEYWRQLDKWNRVSPIKAQFIMTLVAGFLNRVAGSLGNRGTLIDEEPSLELPDGTKKCLCSLNSFNDLVQYLAKELRECNE